MSSDQDLYIEARNYRCFDSDHPLKISLQQGMTAIVGPNNAGKSSVLRFFSEMRKLFSHATAFQHNTVHLTNGVDGVFNAFGLTDASAIFTNTNSLPMLISIEYLDITLKIRIERNYLFKMTLAFKDSDGNKIASVRSSIDSNRLVLRNIETNREFDIVAFGEQMGKLSRVFYVGPFRNVLSQAGAKYYDVTIGAAFINAWHQWKNGGNRSMNKKSIMVSNQLRSIFGFTRLEINSTTEANDLLITVDDLPYSISELGSGFAQFLNVLGSIAMEPVQPWLLLIDEPELHLHPSLQAQFVRYLAEGVSGPTIFATHSQSLARTMAETVLICRKKGAYSKLVEFSREEDMAEFAHEMGVNSFRAIGFVALLLVEGVTEVKVFMELLRKFGLDEKVICIPLGGGNFIGPNRATQLAELTRVCDKIFVCIDSEKASIDSVVHADRLQFCADCRTYGMNVHMLDRRAIENYWTGTALSETFGSSISALGPFDKFDKSNRGWAKADNWKVANQMTVEELCRTDLGDFLVGLQALVA